MKINFWKDFEKKLLYGFLILFVWVCFFLTNKIAIMEKEKEKENIFVEIEKIYNNYEKSKNDLEKVKNILKITN